MKKRLFGFVAFICILTCFAPLCAKADHGPKPTISVNVKNKSGEKAYATILGTHDSGPNVAVVMEGDEIVKGQKKSNVSLDIFKKFAEYKDSDNFVFFGSVTDVTNNEGLSWTYYIQDKFKVLVYYPETDSFSVTDVMKRYTFDNYYTVELNGAADNGHITGKEDSSLNFTMNVAPRLLAFAGRLLFTLVVETLIAFAFGIRHKAGLKKVLIANVTTQVALNVVILLISANKSSFYFCIVMYFLLEILIVIAEAIFYIMKLRKPDKSKYSKIKLILYSLTANLCSAVFGFFLTIILDFRVV